MFLYQFKEETKERLGSDFVDYKESKNLLFDKNGDLQSRFKKGFEDCKEDDLKTLCYELLDEIKATQEKLLQEDFLIILKDEKFYNVDSFWGFVNVELGLDCVFSSYSEICERERECGYKSFHHFYQFVDYALKNFTLEELQRALESIIDSDSSVSIQAKKFKDKLENGLRKQVYAYLLKRLDPENERKNDLGFIKDCEFFANVLSDDAKDFSVVFFDKERDRYETIYLDTKKFI